MRGLAQSLFLEKTTDSLRDKPSADKSKPSFLNRMLEARQLAYIDFALADRLLNRPSLSTQVLQLVGSHARKSRFACVDLLAGVPGCA